MNTVKIKLVNHADVRVRDTCRTFAQLIRRGCEFTDVIYGTYRTTPDKNGHFKTCVIGAAVTAFNKDMGIDIFSTHIMDTEYADTVVSEIINIIRGEYIPISLHIYIEENTMKHSGLGDFIAAINDLSWIKPTEDIRLKIADIIEVLAQDGYIDMELDIESSLYVYWSIIS